jgi:hypothetical protein
MISMTIHIDIGSMVAEIFEIEIYGKVRSQRAVNELSISIQPKFEQDRRRSRGGESGKEKRGVLKNSRDPETYYQKNPRIEN